MAIFECLLQLRLFFLYPYLSFYPYMLCVCVHYLQISVYPYMIILVHYA